MINHVRTLLLNRSGSQTGVNDFLYEYVPPSYQTVTLPDPLNRVRAALFGPTPDPAGLNYRLRQFMPVLHAAEIVAATLCGDPRFTYGLDDIRLFTTSFAPYAVQLYGNNPVGFVTNPGSLVTATGQMIYSCICVGSTEATYGQYTNPPGTIQIPPSWAGGLSAPISLPGSNGVSIVVTGSGMPPTDSFQAFVLRQPAVTLAELPATLESVISAEVGLALFGAATTGRFAQFADWWNSTLLHFRLAGVLLALAYRTDLIRQGN